MATSGSVYLHATAHKTKPLGLSFILFLSLAHIHRVVCGVSSVLSTFSACLAATSCKMLFSHCCLRKSLSTFQAQQDRGQDGVVDSFGSLQIISLTAQ